MPKPALDSYAAALARGQAAKLAWVQSGELVPARILAAKWAVTPQALLQAETKGEVFAMVVNRRRYFPKEFLSLDRADVVVVNNALGAMSPSEKFIFWTRSHGALGGRTLLDTLCSGENGSELARVVRLALDWSAERNASFYSL